MKIKIEEFTFYGVTVRPDLENDILNLSIDHGNVLSQLCVDQVMADAIDKYIDWAVAAKDMESCYTSEPCKKLFNKIMEKDDI